MEKQKNENLRIFQELSSKNVNGFTKKKGQLDYLSWSIAWELLKNECPDATYEVVKNENGLPYFESDLGIMVYTRMTINGLTHEMWLSVMDGANRALKTQPYTILKKPKNGQPYEDTIPAADMNDINRAVMRCLTKNIAMFGLGLHVYEGEDITMAEKEEIQEENFNNQVGFVLGQISNCTMAENLNYVYSKQRAFMKDERIKGAMFDKLQEIIKGCMTLEALNNIYTISTWAQSNPNFTDWCTERQGEIKREFGE